MTDRPGYLRYICRISTVYLAAIFATTAPASAQGEDTFATFQERCLTPMLAFAPYSSDGLRPSPSNRSTLRRFWLSRNGGEGASLAFDSAPEDGRRACAVFTTAEAFPPQFEAWILEEVVAGRFEADGDQRWLTLELVEPRLALEFEEDASGTSARLIETNLES